MNYDILQGVTDGVYIIDTNRKILFWNKAAEEITGYKADEVTGLNCQDDLLKHVDDDGCCLCQKGCPLAKCMDDGNPRQTQAYLSHKDGYRVPVNIRASPMLGTRGEVIGSVEIFNQDAYRMNMIDRLCTLKKQGFIDPTTGLANQDYFQTLLQNKVDNLQNRTQYFGIILADVDNYRNFVEYHGQTIGQEMIKTVAQTLANNCDTNDTAAYQSHDQFSILVEQNDKDQLQLHARRLCHLVARTSIKHDDRNLSVTISIGTTMAQKNDTAQSLMNRANKLLAKSKTTGRNGFHIG